MGFFEKDLRVKITVILLLSVIIMAIVALSISHTVITHEVSNNIEESMLDAARMTRNLLEVALERRTSRMQLLASFPVLRDPASDPALKSEILNLFMENWPIGKGAVVLDTGGNPEFGTGRLGTIGNATDTSWFQNAQLAGITFTYVYKKNELQEIYSNSPMLAVSTPIRDPKEQINAYAVSFTTLDDIKKAIESVRIEKTGHGFLVGKGNMIIAGNLVPGNRQKTDRDRQAINNLIDEMTRDSTGKATLACGGKKYLVTYTPVGQSALSHPELDWAVGVIVPESEAYATVRQITWALIGLTIFVLAIAVITSVLFGRRITRPIEELATTAERIGSGDLTVEVAIRTRDQIGRLAASLLRMRDSLRGALIEAGQSSEGMSVLAEEQSAATQDVFAKAEEIVESVVVLVKNMEAQAQKIQKVVDFTQRMPKEVLASEPLREVDELFREIEILAEVGVAKAVEIASASQDQRVAGMEVSSAARRLSDMAAQLKKLVRKFKVE